MTRVRAGGRVRDTGRPKTVPMQHEGVARQYQAPVGSVAFWEKHGWKRVDRDQGTGVKTKQAAKAEKGGEA